ncbi:MAG: protein kinase domain-containing protein, partial [Stackebrandtia sp.]
MAERLDLVCGPANPLPESAQSFRLFEPLGTGGQADVYKGVRLSGGVSSAPVTVKVFRPSSDRPVEAQFRSWDKGDAVLMDLGGRGVGGICRRIDAFYGPPPHLPGTAPAPYPLPYQVLEFLPGRDLKQLLAVKHRPLVDAVVVLRTLAEVLDAMHRPDSPEIHPSLHMDVKPSNVIVLPSGEAKVIDFTGARYHTPTHMTSISYTPEAAGPEAHGGRVGPSYDVHGFGSVAFFLVTGAQPRGDSQAGGTADAPGCAVLRRHPALDADARLRDHLLAPLADAPGDRPLTVELRAWIDELAALMLATRVPRLGVNWKSAGVAAATGPTPAQTRRIETPAGAGEHPATAPMPVQFAHGHGPGAAHTAAPATQPLAVAPRSPGPVNTRPPHTDRFGRGVVAPRPPSRNGDDAETMPHRIARPPAPKPPLTGPGGRLERLTGGGEFSMVGLLFAFVCWGIWAVD